MIKTITEWDFINSFDQVNRATNFSVAGRKALFEMFEEVNPDMELDPIAICCDFTEYASLEEWKQDYGYEPYDEDEDDDDAVVIPAETLASLKKGDENDDVDDYTR